MSGIGDLDQAFTRRALVAAGAGGVIWTALLARLFQLQVIEGERYRGLAEENGVRLDLAPPRRGMILDRFGVSLASHRRAGRVTITRERAPDLPAVLARISDLIDLSPTRQRRIFDDARRQPAFVPVIVAEELTYEDFARMTIHAADLPGVDVEMSSTRSYPQGRDFAHVLGYVARASDRDLTRLEAEASASERQLVRRLFKHPDMRTGRSGIEFFAEEWLRGEPGFDRVVTNAAGRIIEKLPSEDIAPTPGRDLSITIDAGLQRAAIERFGQESGAAVVIDIATGDILCFVSTPAFDPNDFVNGISQADYDLLRFDERAPLYHKAYDGVYPPGSTFKMVVAAAALETSAISRTRRVYCNGRYTFGNRTWSCWKPGGHGSVNMHEAIKGSCDTYFYEAAKLIGIEALADTSRRFGFGQRWELGMTGGKAGVVPNDAWKRETLGEPWYEGETLNIGIGQGYMTSSPLQLAHMTARIAANGQLIAPNLIGDGPRPEADIPFDEELDPEIVETLKAAMYGVTSEGGGTALRSGDLGLGGPRMAGKTGTAQVRYISQAERARGVIKNEDLERRLRDHALFVGYAPHDTPKYAIAVVVEHGGSGSRAAGPLARDVMAEALRRDSGRTPAFERTASVAGRSKAS
ncbi:MAG: penicillin-binding protein 2 [Pseudomonadota bacterium]